MAASSEIEPVNVGGLVPRQRRDRMKGGKSNETRRLIIELASRRFRAEGFDAVGIASLMAEIGLTHGGFYAHFRSKEELIKEAILHALAEPSKRPACRPVPTARDLSRFIVDFLSTAHRDNPADGSALAALLPEIARLPAATRLAFQTQSNDIVDQVASGLPPSVSDIERRPRAVAIVAQLIGTLQMARLVGDETDSKAILDRGVKDALRVAGLESSDFHTDALSVAKRSSGAS